MKTKNFCSVDLAFGNEGRSICIINLNKDEKIEVIDSFTTEDPFIFQEKTKEFCKKYNIPEVQELDKSTFIPIKKSRKTKDHKSFNSTNYKMFKDGLFNCCNIPFGYNFAIGVCMESPTFNRKRKYK